MKRVLALLLTLPLLSGCLGGDAGRPQDDPGTHLVAPTVTTPSTSLAEVDDVPKYHPHDLWGDRAFVDLFIDHPVPLGVQPAHEAELRPQETSVLVGRREFDLRSDGDDSNTFDKADVVFQGTKALVVKVAWTAGTGETVPGVNFLYKPANSAQFVTVENVPNGEEFYVPLGPGMADMPHQLKLSRWRFALEAHDPQFADNPAAVHLAKGTPLVSMRALNGGERHLDPPHPYNFLEATEKAVGALDRRIDVVVATTDETGTTFLSGTPSLGWRVDPPHIVPWETTLLKVTVTYAYEGPASAATHELALRYTDASGSQLKAPEPTRVAAGEAYYEIPVLANEADDPYAKKSDWTWGVVPVVQGQEGSGEFRGQVRIALVAVGNSEVMT